METIEAEPVKLLEAVEPEKPGASPERRPHQFCEPRVGNEGNLGFRGNLSYHILSILLRTEFP